MAVENKKDASRRQQQHECIHVSQMYIGFKIFAIKRCNPIRTSENVGICCSSHVSRRRFTTHIMALEVYELFFISQIPITTIVACLQAVTKVLDRSKIHKKIGWVLVQVVFLSHTVQVEPRTRIATCEMIFFNSCSLQTSTICPSRGNTVFELESGDGLCVAGYTRKKRRASEKERTPAD
jgi:hypothetical protein